MPELHEFADAVTDEASFLRFVSALRADREAAANGSIDSVTLPWVGSADALCGFVHGLVESEDAVYFENNKAKRAVSVVMPNKPLVPTRNGENAVARGTAAALGMRTP